MLEIKGSVAVITGGSGGIGKALAEYWLINGGKVVIADVIEDALDNALNDLQKISGDVRAQFCNVTKEEDCTALAQSAIDAFGQINLVAPFAGITMDALMLKTDRETGKVTGKMSLDQFQKVVDINLTGVFLTVRECVEQMINHECKGLVCPSRSTGIPAPAHQWAACR